MNNPLVSIIIPSYNRTKFLSDCLRSIIAQTVHDYEIIVINDGGKDLRYLLDIVSEKKLKYLYHTKNQGSSAARNTGLDNANGDYIMFLDDDDVIYPNHLETLLKKRGKKKDIIVYSQAMKAYQEIKNGVYKTIMKEKYSTHYYHPITVLLENIAPIHSFLFPRQCFDKLRFTSNLHTHEDWEVFIKLSQFFDFYFINKVTHEVRYRFDGSTKTSTLQQQFKIDLQNLRNRYRMELLSRIKKTEDKINKKVLDYFAIGSAYMHLGNNRNGELNFKNCLNQLKVSLEIRKYTYYYLADLTGNKRWFKEILNLRIPGYSKLRAYLALENYKSVINVLKTRKYKSQIEVYHIASAYKKIDRLELAKRWFEKVLRNNIALWGGANFHLGDIYLKKVQPVQAAQYFKRALEVNQDHLLARKMLDTIEGKMSKGG